MTHTSIHLGLAAACAALVFQSVSSAQYYYCPSDTPTVGTCNVFPWGQASTRHQHLVTAADLGNARQTIQDIAYAACGTGTFSASQILIRMNHYVGATLSTDFTANLGAGAVTVLNASTFSYSYTANAWADVGLTGTFNYDPTLGDLIIDIEFCGAAGGTSFHRDVRPRAWLNGGICPSPNFGSTGLAALKVRLETTSGGFIPFGSGCGTPPLTIAGTGVPNIGSNVSVAMSNGLASSPGLYLIGTSPANIDLTAFGAPGCTVYTLWFTDVPTVFDGAGNAAALPLSIPNLPFLVGLQLVITGVDVNPPANTLGVTTANGLTMTVGI